MEVHLFVNIFRIGYYFPVNFICNLYVTYVTSSCLFSPLSNSTLK